MNEEDVRRQVQAELGRIGHAELLETASAYLIDPRLEHRDWDYGEPGVRYPFWIVWEHPASNSVVGFCSHGFGPSEPWGLIGRDPSASLGMDAQWFAALEDAVRQSLAWEGEEPPGYEIR